ncbi:helix-turn-helix transcriptional regulator [Shewanella sp. Isolate11]|uniref:XRE family transcriptional regulator n=1 Tax=Shewanella sp. Isolate11 TaxID=2908530 RepID=UPI001EFEC46B|nr:helix-turn-helix transcriptional regulator [Shewanella sp. Isolate11]MCG9697450.1 helix-turn-helix transcriptional regulator [Shewanella sp. Isolate11]
MKTLAENLQEMLKIRGLTQRELAERANMSQVMVHKLVSGKTKSTSKLVDIAHALNCTAEQLKYGVEHQQKTSDASLVDGFDTWDNSTPLGVDEIEVPFYMEVELAAGNGIAEGPQYCGPKLRFSKSTLRKHSVEAEHVVCVKVTGTSMEPVLPNDSTVGIDTSNKTIIDGKMYAINHDGMLRVKRLYQLPGNGLRLRSYNIDEYPDEIYDGEIRKHITIIGRVFWYSVLV